MTQRFKSIVEKTVQQIEGNQQEKDDLYEELMIHLELSKEQYVQEGYTEWEAENLAIENFGDELVIGEQIQQAMFPYRKEMMRILAIGSIVFTISVYLAQLFGEGDAFLLWLILSMGSSTSILVFSIQSFAFLNRRLWMNSLLLIHIALYLFGILLASGITEMTISIPLTILVGLMILLGIVLVYRTTIHDYMSNEHPLPKHAKWLHFINITAGIFVIGFMLFFMWGILAFTGTIAPPMLFPIIPVLIWLILYIIQMNFIRKGRMKIAYVIAIVPLLVILLSIGFLTYGFM